MMSKLLILFFMFLKKSLSIGATPLSVSMKGSSIESQITVIFTSKMNTFPLLHFCLFSIFFFNNKTSSKVLTNSEAKPKLAKGNFDMKRHCGNFQAILEICFVLIIHVIVNTDHRTIYTCVCKSLFFFHDISPMQPTSDSADCI